MKYEQSKYYAHSGVSERNIRPQLYKHHVQGTIFRLKDLNISNSDYDFIKYLLIFHDIGKLDKSIQNTLSQPDASEDKILNHVAAGVNYMIRKYEQTKNIFYKYCAWLIHSHHIGLSDKDDLFKRNQSIGIFNKDSISFTDSIKDLRPVDCFVPNQNKTINEYVIDNLDTYIEISKKILPEEHKFVEEYEKNIPFIDPKSIHLRLYLSLLVECDHYDTSRHYRFIPRTDNKLEPIVDIGNLDNYVSNISKRNRKNNRQLFRDHFYEYCKKSKYSRFNRVDGTVGIGKTFGTLRLALRIADEQKLDKLFTIAPFINVISQTVDQYKKGIGRNDINYINEIHSKCEFANIFFRKYSTLWSCPINISTSIQFFKSLTTNNPTELRKLHNYRNSVIILDEFHVAMPHENWKLVLDILQQISEEWNIYVIFSSGTNVPYWSKDIFNINNFYIENILPDDFYSKMNNYEKVRVKCKICTSKFDSFSQFSKEVVQSSKNVKSTLVVTNTIKNAILVFKELKAICRKTTKVYNITSALTPIDKEIIINNINESIKKKEKIYVVSTSIIECGVDMNFDMGYREIAPYASIVQTGGRINRNGKKRKSILHVFSFSKANKDATSNWSFKNEIEICEDILYRTGGVITQDWCCVAVGNYLKNADRDIRGTKYDVANELQRINDNYGFKTLREKFKIINSANINIIVDKNLKQSIMDGKSISWTEIQRNTISLIESNMRMETVMANCEPITIKDNEWWFCGEYDMNNGGVAKYIL